MAERPTKAMILAAGLGKRMRPLTDHLPKPLIEVDGRTLLDHAIERLTSVGVSDIVVNMHYMADKVKKHLKGRNKPAIHLSDETGELLDTGGGIAKALPLLGDKPFFTHNSDSIWIDGIGANLERMIAMWDDGKMDALMLLAPLVKTSGYDGMGDFTMDKVGRLTRREDRHVAPFAWTGVQIIHPRLFTDLPPPPFSTNVLWDRAIEKDRLYGIRLDGFWMHVGTPDGKDQAEQYLNELKTAIA